MLSFNANFTNLLNQRAVTAYWEGSIRIISRVFSLLSEPVALAVPQPGAISLTVRPSTRQLKPGTTRRRRPPPTTWYSTHITARRTYGRPHATSASGLSSPSSRPGWQVNHHLTLNFGLRWEHLPAFIETQGDLASFDPQINSIVVPDKFFTTVGNSPLLTTIYNGVLESFNGCSLPNKNTALTCTNVVAASKAGLPQGLRQTPVHDFDPRVSLAYRPFNNDKTVIRAGFGLFTATTLGPMSFNNAGVGLSDLLSFPQFCEEWHPSVSISANLDSWAWSHWAAVLLKRETIRISRTQLQRNGT